MPPAASPLPGKKSRMSSSWMCGFPTCAAPKPPGSCVKTRRHAIFPIVFVTASVMAEGREEINAIREQRLHRQADRHAHLREGNRPIRQVSISMRCSSRLRTRWTMKNKPVILVVDDQPLNIELLEAHLVPQGYDDSQGGGRRSGPEGDRGKHRRPRAARRDDAEDRRVRGLQEDQGGRAAPEHPGRHDHGAFGEGGPDQGHRGGGRGLHLQADRQGGGARPGEDASQDEGLERPPPARLRGDQQPDELRRGQHPVLRPAELFLSREGGRDRAPDHPQSRRCVRQAEIRHRRRAGRAPGLAVVPVPIRVATP